MQENEIPSTNTNNEQSNAATPPKPNKNRRRRSKPKAAQPHSGQDQTVAEQTENGSAQVSVRLGFGGGFRWIHPRRVGVVGHPQPSAPKTISFERLREPTRRVGNSCCASCRSKPRSTDEPSAGGVGVMGAA